MIHDSNNAYARCQVLAREGLELDIEGSLTPSARRVDGTNVPVFRRQALSEPEILGVMALSRHAGTGEVMARHG